MVHVQQHEHFKVLFIVLHCNFSPQPSALYIQTYLQYTWDNDQSLTVLKAAQSLWTSYCSVELSARRQTLAYLILRFSVSCLRKSDRIPWTMDGIVTRPPPTWDEKIRKKYNYAPNGVWIHFLRVPAAEDSIGHASIWQRTLKNDFPFFPAESLGRIHLIQQRTKMKFSSLSGSVWNKSSRNCCTTSHQTVQCALGSTQPLKMSTRKFLGVKTPGV